METRESNKKTVILWTVWLFIIAAAAFCSMRYFTRPVFGNNLYWNICFGVLALCLLLSAAVKKPLFSLILCVAAAVVMTVVIPYNTTYAALFFPVSLQAALWEAARNETKTGRAVFILSLLLVPATIPFRLQLREFMRYNASGYGGSDPMGEAYVCLAGLILLLALWIVLLIRSLHRKQPQKKTSAKKSGRNKQKKNDGNRLPAVYAVSALHVVLSCATCLQLFSGEYIKLLFFSAGLFVFYLIYRRDPVLRETPLFCRQSGNA